MRRRNQFLTAQWLDLVFLSFAVDRKLLEPFLPVGTELDTFDGTPIMSLVAFQFLDTKILGVKPPFFHSFSELNLRFYVRDVTTKEPGVVFIKEVCPFRAVAWTARALFNEKFLIGSCYFTNNFPKIQYQFSVSRAATLKALSVDVQSTSLTSEEARFAHFAVERYHGFSKWRKDSKLHYDVAHVPWIPQKAILQEYELDLDSLYGDEIGSALKGPPLSVIYTRGSEIQLSFGHAEPFKRGTYGK